MIASVIAAAVCSVSELPDVMRALLGVPLIALGPGYLVAAAALPRFEGTTGDRLALSVGLSLSTAIVIAGLVYWIGDNPPGWTTSVALGLGACVSGAIAIARGSYSSLFGFPRLGNGPIPVLPLLLTVILLAGAAAITAVGIQEEDQPQFTELSLLQAGDSGEPSISIRNEEGVELSYRLEVRCGTELAEPVQELTIEDGASWSDQLPEDQCVFDRLRALLWRLDRPVDEGLPYREAYLPSPAATTE